MAQEYTSANTSVNHLPSIVGYVDTRHGWIPKTVNMDYGSGRYPQNMYLALGNRGVANFSYDPFNLPLEWNERNLIHIAQNPVDTVTLANVLNVIKEPYIRGDILDNIRKLIKPDGRLFISIYEGNGSGKPASSKAGCWQNNHDSDFYSMEIMNAGFKILHKNKKFITAKPLTKGN